MRILSGLRVGILVLLPKEDEIADLSTGKRVDVSVISVLTGNIAGQSVTPSSSTASSSSSGFERCVSCKSGAKCSFAKVSRPVLSDSFTCVKLWLSVSKQDDVEALPVRDILDNCEIRRLVEVCSLEEEEEIDRLLSALGNSSSTSGLCSVAKIIDVASASSWSRSRDADNLLLELEKDRVRGSGDTEVSLDPKPESACHRAKQYNVSASSKSIRSKLKLITLTVGELLNLPWPVYAKVTSAKGDSVNSLALLSAACTEATGDRMT